MHGLRDAKGVTRREAVKTLLFSSAFLGGSLPLVSRSAPEFRFGGNGLHFLAFGDFGTGDKAQKKVAAQMEVFAAKLDSPLTSVLALGDNFYKKMTPERFGPGFEQMYAGPYLQVPFYACLGNHDYGPDYDSKQGHAKAAMELDYARDHPDSRWKLPAKWYKREFPDGADPLVRVLFLDSNYFETALTPQEKLAQKRWIEAELGQPTRAKWTWVVAHHPLFSDTTSRHDNHRLIKVWGPYLEKHPVSLYISGHDHNLQHIQVKGYQPSFLVSGGGGAGLYEVTSSGRGYSKQIFGFDHIHVNEKRILVQVIDVDGNRLHGFERDRAGNVRVL